MLTEVVSEFTKSDQAPWCAGQDLSFRRYIAKYTEVLEGTTIVLTIRDTVAYIDGVRFR